MAQLVRCYFRETGVTAADSSFKEGTAFEFALDVEFTQQEIDIGGQFRVMVAVKNWTNCTAAFNPLPVAPAPAHNIAAVVAGPRNQTFAYTVPANTGVAGNFIEGEAALVIGVTGQDTDMCEADCVIIP